MRHKKTGRKLGVVTKHRRAMFRNMTTDLFRHEKITTTDTRAKEIRRVAEKIITLAKKGTLQSRRQAATFIKDKDVLRKLFEEIADKYKDRPGGYTRIIKMGYRKGDNAPLSLIEIVQEDYKPKKKKKKSTIATAKQQTDIAKKSTKKESAEELGLIEDAAKGATVVEAKAEKSAEIDEDKVIDQTTEKEDEPIADTLNEKETESAEHVELQEAEAKNADEVVEEKATESKIEPDNEVEKAEESVKSEENASEDATAADEAEITHQASEEQQTKEENKEDKKE